MNLIDRSIRYLEIFSELASKMGYSIGLNEFKTPVKLIKSLVAELIGTTFLVMIGCGSAIAGGNNFTGVRDI